MSRCARCDWQHDPDSDLSGDEQLVEHAENRSHPVCGSCGRSLTFVEPATCERCIHDAQALLAGIFACWVDLPNHLNRPGSARYDLAKSASSADRALPGGDVLALLGSGSEGLAEDGETTRDGDPVSVSYELGWWVRILREARGFPVTPLPAVVGCLEFLEVHNQWAADHHDGYPRYLADLRRLHGLLERATGRHRAPSRAGADCFACGEPLVRLIGADGLEQDVVTCIECHASYNQQRYLLALGARVDEANTLDRDGELYGAIEQVAKRTGRSPHTLRSWAGRRLVRSTRHAGLLFLHIADIDRRNAESATRQRRPRSTGGAS